MKNELGILKKVGLGIVFTLFWSVSVTAQSNRLFTIKGEVYDAQTNEVLSLASIRLEGTSYTTVSNDDGVFSIKYNENENPTHLVVSYLGYRTARIALGENDSRKETLRVGLISDSIRLEGVDVNNSEDTKAIVLKMLDTYDKQKPFQSKTAVYFFRERINRRNRNLSIT